MPMPNRTKRADARYIADICNELAELAERDGFDTGTYLLRMASLEFAQRAEEAGCATNNSFK